MQNCFTGEIPYNIAAGSETGKAKLLTIPDSVYSTLQNHREQYISHSNIEKVQVKKIRPDSLVCSQKKIVLKIDVQGAELDVLKGCEGIFDNVVLIILETCLFRQTDADNEISTFASYLSSRAFIPVYFCSSGLISGVNTIPMEYDVLWLNTKFAPPPFIYPMRNQSA